MQQHKSLFWRQKALITFLGGELLFHKIIWSAQIGGGNSFLFVQKKKAEEKSWTIESELCVELQATFVTKQNSFDQNS